MTCLKLIKHVSVYLCNLGSIIIHDNNMIIWQGKLNKSSRRFCHFHENMYIFLTKKWISVDACVNTFMLPGLKVKVCLKSKRQFLQWNNNWKWNFLVNPYTMSVCCMVCITPLPNCTPLYTPILSLLIQKPCICLYSLYWGR